MNPAHEKLNPTPCDKKCVSGPTDGISWWKCLGYKFPCICAYNKHQLALRVYEEANLFENFMLNKEENLLELARMAKNELARIDKNELNRLKREKKKAAERKKKEGMILKVRVKRYEPGAAERPDQVVKHWTQPNYFDQIEALGFY